MSWAGYDSFCAKANSGEERICRVCGTMCTVWRNVYGPTGIISAMAKHSTYHDDFVCPHTDEEWHEQALRLAVSIDETPSKRVAALIKTDLDELVHDHLC